MKLSINEKEAIDWLCRAQDVTPDGGLSKYYVLGKGWSKESYKEVSGYIIPTFFEIYARTKKEEYKLRAFKIADWEMQVQDKEGKWEYVFDTGQVLLGLTRAYREPKNKTQKERYLRSILKAADFLINVQSPDGNWSKKEFALGIRNKLAKIFNLFGNAHNTRTAWALLETWLITKDEKYKQAAVKNLNWVIKQQLKNGYFKHCHTYLHYLVYTASGLLESGLILNDARYIDSAKLFADACLPLVEKNKFMPGNFDDKFNPVGKIHSSLTSDCQLSILFFKLHNLTKNKRYLEAAEKLLDFVRTNQDLSSEDEGRRGGIPGSYPLDGQYCPNTILSWATKFYLDALLIKETNKMIKS